MLAKQQEKNGYQHTGIDAGQFNKMQVEREEQSFKKGGQGRREDV